MKIEKYKPGTIERKPVGEIDRIMVNTDSGDEYELSEKEGKLLLTVRRGTLTIEPMVSNQILIGVNRD